MLLVKTKAQSEEEKNIARLFNVTYKWSIVYFRTTAYSNGWPLHFCDCMCVICSAKSIRSQPILMGELRMLRNCGCGQSPIRAQLQWRFRSTAAGSVFWNQHTPRENQCTGKDGDTQDQTPLVPSTFHSEMPPNRLNQSFMKPFVALTIPGMYLVYKYNQFKRQHEENQRRKVTEKELQHLNHKIVSETYTFWCLLSRV